MKNTLQPYNLFLDDVREDPSIFFGYEDMEWVIVKSVAEFISYIEEHGCPQCVSFDHDLADEHYYDLEVNYESYKEQTGMDAADWFLFYLKENALVPEIRVHSMNPVGRANIRRLFVQKGYRVIG